MIRLSWAIALSVTLGSISSGFAQSPKTEKKTSKSASPREQVNQRFDRNTPKIGEPLPNLSAFDSNGKPFKLSSLKGEYAVLVFGCLT